MPWPLEPEGIRDFAQGLDEILVVDHYAAKAWIDRYDFAKDGLSTEGKGETIAPEPFQTVDVIPPHGDHRPGEYAELVVKAKESFRRGDLFEKRTRLMADWASYCASDSRAGVKVVPIRAAAEA